MSAKPGHLLDYPPGTQRPEDERNQRNGKNAKTVLISDGPIRLDVPRNLDGSFASFLIPRYKRRYTGYDDKNIAMCARGMTVRESRVFLSEQCDTDVPPDFIISVIDKVIAEIVAWQQLPLQPMYPIIVSMPWGSKFVKKH